MCHSETTQGHHKAGRSVSALYQPYFLLCRRKSPEKIKEAVEEGIYRAQKML